MNTNLAIQSGIYKGRKIPVPLAIKGNSNFTSALLKKSVFSIIDSYDLQEEISTTQSLFIDLFSGSGQMGLEAISRGFKNSAFFELDRIRFRNLKEILLPIRSDLILLHRDAFRGYDSFDSSDYQSLVFYIDPPYSFWEKESEKIKRLIDNIRESYNTKKIVLMVQAPKNPNWEGFEVRQAGNNTLLVSKNII